MPVHDAMGSEGEHDHGAARCSDPHPGTRHFTRSRDAGSDHMALGIRDIRIPPAISHLCPLPVLWHGLLFESGKAGDQDVQETGRQVHGHGFMA